MKIMAASREYELENDAESIYDDVVDSVLEFNGLDTDSADRRYGFSLDTDWDEDYEVLNCIITMDEKYAQNEGVKPAIRKIIEAAGASYDDAYFSDPSYYVAFSL